MALSFGSGERPVLGRTSMVKVGGEYGPHSVKLIALSSTPSGISQKSEWGEGKKGQSLPLSVKL